MPLPSPTPAAPEYEYITAYEAAALVGCTHATIRRRINDGTLPAYRFGPRTIRIKREDLDLLFNPVQAQA